MDVIKPAPGGASALALRVLRVPMVLLVVEASALIGLASAYGLALNAMGIVPDSPGGLAATLAMAVVLILAWKGLRRGLEGAPDAEFALPRAGLELGAGLLLGAALFSAITGLVWLMGGLDIERVRGPGHLQGMLAMAIFSGVFEEALFRGVLLRHLEAMLGSWAALAITSALFGAAHLGNPDSSLFAAFAIAVEAGVLLGAAYLLTRRLWLAVGIHAAWNFTQGWVFSIPVSGGEAPLGLLATRREGPDWLTGGAFGLEASVPALAVATMAGLLLLRRAVTSDGLRPPMWRR